MIDYEFQDLFLKQDIDKQLLIEYDTGTITNNEIQSEQFTLEESLCSESNLRFGCCESSSVKFTVLNIFEPLKNKWLDISMVLAGNDSNPFKFGRFKVYSDVPTADRKIREITAYDALYDIINADVAEWYDTILPEKNSTVTLKQFRNSFFMHFGIEQEVTELPNDGMTVEKTIEPEQLSGKTVVSAICEINGCFGHINRNGKFAYVFLRPLTKGLYPSTTLYPANDLYPSEPNSQRIGTGRYISAQYEDYEVEKITKLQIRQEENDIGVVVGDGENAYIIQDNFLAYGKDLDILQGIAQNVFEKIRNIFYRPFSAKAKGNPCFELGDGISLSTKTAIIDSYILERTLSGVQALRDNYTANGEQTQDAGVNSLSNSIIQLKGKTNKLTRNLEETKLEMSDMEAGLSNTITITAQSLQTEIKDTKNGLQSQITQNAGSISSEIARAKDAESTLSSKITQTDESIRSDVSKTYSTKTETSSAAANALSSANASTDEKLKSYSTTTQMNSAIDQKADNITLSVDKKITETKTYADSSSANALSSANASTDEKLKSYSTTTQMNSAISLSAEGIRSDVSATYETKTNAGKQYTALSSSITQTASDITAEVKRAKDAESTLSASIKVNAEKIESKVSNGNVSSVISQEAGAIAIKSNRISIDSTYFTLTKDGKVTATSVELSGKITATSGEIGGFTIAKSAIYSGSKSSLSSTIGGVYIGTDGISLGSKFKINTSGEITSTGGSIGGFTIGDSKIYSGSKSTLSSNYSGVYIGTDGIALGADFKVGTDGKLTATGAELSGKITATSGTIGGFTIGSAAIYSGSKSSLSSSMSGVYLGTDGISLGANFKVGDGGDVSIKGNGSIAFSSGSNSMSLNYSGISFGSSTNITATEIAFGNTKLNSTGLTIRGSNWFNALNFTGDSSAGYLKIGSTTAFKFSAGEVAIPISVVNIGTNSGRIGFFSGNGSTKISVATVTQTTVLSAVASKVNELISALKSYGLV